MIEYNKIDTLYKRDMEGSKRLLEGEFRNPTVEYLKGRRRIKMKPLAAKLTRHKQRIIVKFLYSS